MAQLSREWLTALNDYVQGFEEVAHQAAGVAAETLLEGVKDEARNRPGWDALADNIEVWSDDGILIVGVKDEAFVSQAFALEYGDETQPPDPLFRTLATPVSDANQAYTDHMADAGMINRR